MKYRLIQDVEGIAVKSEFTDVMAAMEVRGFTFIGFNENHRQRKELQGQPMYKELAGPMFDGDAIRYEDQRSNQTLSI